MIDAQYILDGTLNSGGGVTGTAITVTRDSTNVIDLLAARDVGVDAELGIHMMVTEAFTAAGAATLQIELETSADNITYYSLLSSEAYPKAQLIIGAPVFRYAVPLNQLLNATAGVLKAPGRYLKLVYTVATGPMTAGKVFAWLGPNEDRNQFTVYPGNYTAAVTAGEV